MQEEWRIIPGFNDKYLISNLGRIKSLRFHYAGIGWVDRELIISQRISKAGNYYIACLRLNSKVHTKKVHRLIAEAFIPNPENKPFVNHIDGNKKNNSIGNLEWCTSSENNLHAYAIGLRESGEDHKNSKLTNSQAKEIFLSKVSYTKLAKMYLVSIGSIAQIKQGKSYKTATRT